MEINSAEFVMSNTDYRKCPPEKLPEYAFIGRSNVGKSSLINMLANRKGLAKTSGTPGKTQTINHFIINKSWYLADLPGYGYTKTGKAIRETFAPMITNYLRGRLNLLATFILIDSRHEALINDISFLEWMGTHELPFNIVFTKSDKLSATQLNLKIEQYKEKLLQSWEVLPPIIISSAENGLGKKEILDFIDETNSIFTING
jgi:GTP-binding protein